MTMRCCVYKGCENYSINQIAYSHDGTVGGFTLFQFPKDAVRRKRWMELGQVWSGIPEHKLIMCSKHFNSKYFSTNPRRTTLIGAAEPKPYEGSDDDTTLVEVNSESNAKDNVEADSLDDQHSYFLLDDANDQQVNETVVHQTDLDQGDYQVESTTIQEERKDVIVLRQSTMGEIHQFTDNRNIEPDSAIKKASLEDSSIRKVIISSQPKFIKRKLTSLNDSTYQQRIVLNKVPRRVIAGETPNVYASELNQTPELKSKKSPHKLESANASQTLSPSKTDGSSLIDSNHVTTFIFKGEEYVQMPRRHYVQEKIEFKRAIRQYESVLRNFKQQLSSLNLI